MCFVPEFFTASPCLKGIALTWIGYLTSRAGRFQNSPWGSEEKKVLLAGFKMKFINFGGDYMTGFLG